MGETDDTAGEVLEELMVEPGPLDKLLQGAKMVTITVYYTDPEEDEAEAEEAVTDGA